MGETCKLFALRLGVPHGSVLVWDPLPYTNMVLEATCIENICSQIHSHTDTHGCGVEQKE